MKIKDLFHEDEKYAYNLWARSLFCERITREIGRRIKAISKKKGFSALRSRVKLNLFLDYYIPKP